MEQEGNPFDPGQYELKLLPRVRCPITDESVIRTIQHAGIIRFDFNQYGLFVSEAADGSSLHQGDYILAANSTRARTVEQFAAIFSGGNGETRLIIARKRLTPLQLPRGIHICRIDPLSSQNFGVQLRSADGNVFVMAVEKHSSGWNAGLRADDRILKFNAFELNGMDPEQQLRNLVETRLTGKVPFDLTVQRTEPPTDEENTPTNYPGAPSHNDHVNPNDQNSGSKPQPEGSADRSYSVDETNGSSEGNGGVVGNNHSACFVFDVSRGMAEENSELLAVIGTPVKKISVRSLKHLTSLDVSQGQLHNIDHSMMPEKVQFSELNISSNPIKNIENGEAEKIPWLLDKNALKRAKERQWKLVMAMDTKTAKLNNLAATCISLVQEAEKFWSPKYNLRYAHLNEKLLDALGVETSDDDVETCSIDKEDLDKMLKAGEAMLTVYSIYCQLYQSTVAKYAGDVATLYKMRSDFPNDADDFLRSMFWYGFAIDMWKRRGEVGCQKFMEEQAASPPPSKSGLTCDQCAEA